MKVLVTGATGFVGRAITGELAARGHKIRALARRAAGSGRSLGRKGGNVEWIDGNVLDPAGLADAARGMDAIIHLVGIISETRKLTFDRVHVEGTRNMLRAAQSAGVMRYIHMSALGTRPGAAARYHQSKWAAEEAVRASGLQYTIFRPSLIYGAGDHFVNFFAGLSRWSPILPIMGSDSSRMAPVSVETVARAFVASLLEPRAVGKTYDLCSKECITFRELLGAILRATGRRRWCARIPVSAAWLQAVVLEFLYKDILGRPSPLNRDQIIMLQEDNTGNPAPAQELFGLPDPAFEEGIRSFISPVSRL